MPTERPTPQERMLLIKQLLQAINELPTYTAEIIVEDTMGGQYELVRSRAIGTLTDDPGLILKIRRTR